MLNVKVPFKNLLLYSDKTQNEMHKTVPLLTLMKTALLKTVHVFLLLFFI